MKFYLRELLLNEDKILRFLCLSPYTISISILLRPVLVF